MQEPAMETLNMSPRYSTELRENHWGSFALHNIKTPGPLRFETSPKIAERLCLEEEDLLGVFGTFGSDMVAAKTQSPDGNWIYYIKSQHANRVVREWGPTSRKAKYTQENPSYSPSPFSDREGLEEFLKSVAEPQYGIYAQEVVVRPLEMSGETAKIDLYDIMTRLMPHMNIATIQKAQLFRGPKDVPLSAEDVAKKLRTPSVGFASIKVGQIKDHPDISISLSLQPNPAVVDEKKSYWIEPKGKGTMIEMPVGKGPKVTYTKISEESKRADVEASATQPSLLLVVSISPKHNPSFDSTEFRTLEDSQKAIAKAFQT